MGGPGSQWLFELTNLMYILTIRTSCLYLSSCSNSCRHRWRASWNSLSLPLRGKACSIQWMYSSQSSSGSSPSYVLICSSYSLEWRERDRWSGRGQKDEKQRTVSSPATRHVLSVFSPHSARTAANQYSYPLLGVVYFPWPSQCPYRSRDNTLIGRLRFVNKVLSANRPLILRCQNLSRGVEYALCCSLFKFNILCSFKIPSPVQ